MTEEEWLACEDPTRLIKHLRGRTSPRKLRLLSAAAVHQVEFLFSSDICRLALDLTFRMADELVPESVGMDLRRSGWEYIRNNAGKRTPGSTNADNAVMKAILPLPEEAVRFALWETAKALAHHKQADGEDKKEKIEWAKSQLMPLFRDILHFHPITLDPSWLTSTVISLAQQMYGSRDFSAMPILADALMDAGCSNETILRHCRGPGPHVRGCWVCDLCLNKS
jgi:hypothetical protein